MLPIKRKFTSFIILCITLLLTSCSQIKENVEEIADNEQNYVGVSIHDFFEQDISGVSKAGFQYVRLDLMWSKIEKDKGIYDFSSSGFDELMENLKKYGLKPYFILGYSNELYEKGQSVVTDEGREAFKNFVTAAVNRYGEEGTIWEIWNEPNLEKFWNGQPSYNNYFELVKTVEPVIKNKKGIVVTPAISSVNSSTLDWLNNVFKLGLLDYTDYISIHPYRDGIPETALEDYTKVRNLIGKYTEKHIPLISGEWGYSAAHFVDSGNKESTQAQYITRSLLVNNMADIQMSILYNWKNTGNNESDAQSNFGIVYNNGKPKTGFSAIKTYNEILTGFLYNERISTQNKENYLLKYRNSKDQIVYVYWTTGNTNKEGIELSGNEGDLVSMVGKRSSITWNGKIILNFTSAPSYIVLKEK